MFNAACSKFSSHAERNRAGSAVLKACYIFEAQAVRLGMILLLIVLILLIAAVPTWPYSRGWGYYPSGGLGLVLIIVLVLFFLGYLR